MCEFSAMKNIWECEFTYEIMVEFIDLKLLLIQLQICFGEGKCFPDPK